MQLQLHYAKYTTPQLQLHYTTTKTTAALHHTTSSSCGWGDRPGDHCDHCNHSQKHSSNHLWVHQWIRSAILDSQQPNSPICFLFWNFRHCLVRHYAALLVFIVVYCPICFLRPVEIIAASLCSNSWDCGRCSFPALVCSWRWMHGFQNVEGRSRSASRWVKPASCLFLGAWYTLSKTQTCSMRENTTTTTSSPTADIFEQTDRPCICNYVCFMFFRHRHRLIL